MVSPRWYVLCSIPVLLFVLKHCYKPPVLIPAMDESTGYRFDVFLGFRDLKAPLGFTDHLAKARVYIIVISSAHVSPVFLDELVLMVQQRKATDHLVIPIFYHVHPSVVKCHTGPFIPSFLHLEQDLEVSRNRWNEAIILAADPRGLFPFHLSDDVVDTLQEQLLQQASCHKKEAEDINQQLFKRKEALHDIAGIKPVHVDEDSHESETVKLIVGRAVKHVATKQSLSNALLGISQ